MSELSLSSPFPIFTDIDGDPLDNGYIYVGTAGLNAETNPIQAYWDAALTVPAAQPIRTLNGYPSRSGSPARIYVNVDDCSTLVKNKNGSLVFSSLNQTTAVPSGAITFIQAGTGAVSRTAQTKLRESVSVKDFGAVGDGITDDTDAIQTAAAYAVANGRSLYIPAGTYLMAGTVTVGNTVATVHSHVHIYGDGKSSVIKCNGDFNPILVQGVSPDTDTAGSRHDGRVVLESLMFLGNGAGIGFRCYGVQGVALNNVIFYGWGVGEEYQNTDIVYRSNVITQGNSIAVRTKGTGYAVTGGFSNSFVSVGGMITNNTVVGIQYFGGLSFACYGVNFANNLRSIVVSDGSSVASGLTQMATIQGCYFEGDTQPMITLGGGGASTVAGCSVTNNTALMADTETFILVQAGLDDDNYKLVVDNNFLTLAGGVGSYTYIDDSSSTAKVVALAKTAKGIFTPTFTGLTVVNGTGNASYVGEYSVSGNYVHWTVQITITGTCTTSAAPAGATYFTGFPAKYPPKPSTFGELFGSNFSVLDGTPVDYGNGLLSHFNRRAYCPAWAAVNSNIYISGSYRLS